MAIASPVEARRLGIGMVFQHFSLFDELTVAENIAVALSGTLDPAARCGRASPRSAAATGSRSSPTGRCGRSPPASGSASRSCAASCRTRSSSILDEPTSVLTPQEAERLFETLERLAAEGCAILYISHKLEEVRRLCRRATILRGRQGRRHSRPARAQRRARSRR